MTTEVGRSHSEPSGRPLWPIRVVALVAVFSILVYAWVGLLMAATGEPFRYFSRDPASTLGGHPLVGALTYVGVLILWGTAVASLLASALVSRAGARRLAAPLLVAGIGLAYLAIDDLLQIHEDLVPRLGIEQELVLGAYAIVAGAYVWWFRDVFRENEWPVLVLALAALGTSIAVDQFGNLVVGGERKRFLEEGFKLFGLSLLATYFVRLALRLHECAYARVAERR